jgi:mannose/cellobiose epimerase-like protein (N-acyl-D-glucosamine 2-epimerase family)
MKHSAARRRLPLLAATLLLSVCPSMSSAQDRVEQKESRYLQVGPAAYSQFEREAEAMLQKDVLGVWFPRTVDNENGGFRSNFTREWQPYGKESKFSVFQGRMTWISAQVAMRRPELRNEYLPIAEHGVDYLTSTLWDKEKGGFYWGLDEKGQISPQYTDGKQLYGMSFVIYGLAAAYQVTKDPRALEYAQRGFHWIEEHAHDEKNGGYFEWLTRAGAPVQGHPETGVVELLAVTPFPIGYKSMNTHIHLLEAFSQLYEVWKDEIVRQRVQELLTIIRDKVCVDPGAMNLYFTNAWQPFPDHDSYGHDVETAYLMLEAEDVLGKGHDPRTERMAKMLVDHALHYGWDQKLGGFYGEGTTMGEPEDKLKAWWVEFEGLNALLMMHEKYGGTTDVYFRAFQQQWSFIKNYQVDGEFHGVFPSVGEDGKPANAVKGETWKAAYHDGRALLNVTERLHRLAAE